MFIQVQYINCYSYEHTILTPRFLLRIHYIYTILKKLKPVHDNNIAISEKGKSVKYKFINLKHYVHWICKSGWVDFFLIGLIKLILEKVKMSVTLLAFFPFIGECKWPSKEEYWLLFPAFILPFILDFFKNYLYLGLSPSSRFIENG